MVVVAILVAISLLIAHNFLIVHALWFDWNEIFVFDKFLRPAATSLE